MTSDENKEKNSLILEEINLLVDKKKIELTNYEDQIKESGEILQSLEELKHIYDSECEKFTKIKKNNEISRKENEELLREKKRLQEIKDKIKNEIELLEAHKTRVSEKIFFKKKEGDCLRQDIESINHEAMIHNENFRKIMLQIDEQNNKLEKIKGFIHAENLKFENIKLDSY